MRLEGGIIRRVLLSAMVFEADGDGSLFAMVCSECDGFRGVWAWDGRSKFMARIDGVMVLASDGDGSGIP